MDIAQRNVADEEAVADHTDKTTNLTEQLAEALSEKLASAPVDTNVVADADADVDADEKIDIESEMIEVEDDEAAVTEVLAENATLDPRSDGSEPGFDGDFRPALIQPNEFVAYRSSLVEWPHHLRGGSRAQGLNHHSLTVTATDPMALPAIKVLPAPESKLYVIDGRAILEAIDAVHGRDIDLSLRCEMLAGCEADAVQQMCDQALGTLDASAIEKARALRSLKTVLQLSNLKIAERYPRLTPTKVSLMVTAAELEAAHPILFQALEEPDRAPISFAVRIAKAMKSMTTAQIGILVGKAQAIVDDGKVLLPIPALQALGVIAPPKRKRVKMRTIKPVQSDPVLCSGVKVGSREVLSDGFTRLRFPARSDVEKMTDNDRAETIHAFQQAVADWFA